MAENQNQILNQIYVQALTGLAEGKSSREVTESLIQQGVSPQLAQQIVAQANRAKKAAMRQQGFKMFAAGIGLFILGAVITGATYSAAKPGGLFLVTTGLFIGGVANIFRGLARMVLG